MRNRLGSISRETFQGMLAEVAGQWDKHLDEWWGQYQEGGDPRQRAFGLLNALGTAYGIHLFRQAAARLPENPDAETLRAAAGELRAMARRQGAAREALAPEAFREALAVIPVPPGDSPEELWQFSLDDGGLYIRDFHASIMDVLQLAAMTLDEASNYTDDPFTVVRHGDRFVPQVLMELDRESLDRQLLLVLRAANREIKQRTSYGAREVRLPKKGEPTVVFWSNAAEAWGVDEQKSRRARQAMRKGQEGIELDANEILLPYHPWLVERILTEFDRLPLYSQSMEARHRGAALEANDRGMREVFRMLIRQANPYLDPEDLSLESAATWEIAQKAKEGDRGALERIELLFAEAGDQGSVMPFYRIFDEWMRR